MVREAYAPRRDDDSGQAGAQVRRVLDEAARERLVGNVTGHPKDGVSPQVPARAVEHRRNVGKELGDRVSAYVNGG